MKKIILFLFLFSVSVFGQDTTLESLKKEKSSLIAQQSALRNKADTLAQSFTERYPDLIAVRKQLESIDLQVAEISKRIETLESLSSLPKESSQTVKEILAIREKLKTCVEGCGLLKQDLAAAYQRASKKPEIIAFLFGQISGELDKEQDSTRLNDSELLRILVIQNQRIIELLEKMANKPK